MTGTIPAPLVSFRPFVAADALAIVVQSSQRIELGLDRSVKTIAEATAMEYAGPAWTAIGRDGRILACAGFAETFPGVQAVAWAMLAAGIGAAHLAITRYARRRLSELRYRRIELIAAYEPKAEQWAILLGFEPAHVLRNFGAASERCILFEVLRDAAA